jgi:hypothetical protein
MYLRFIVLFFTFNYLRYHYWRALKMENQSIIEKILNSNGKIFTVTFIKKDGSIRELNGRLGVIKHLKGGVSTLNPDRYITVYDLQSKVYRAVNKFTIQSVKGL